MLRMRAAPSPIRFAWAALFALLLSVHVLASSGYMPQLAGGRLTLMLCPDGQWTTPTSAMAGMPGMEGDNGRSPGNHHQTCPYAAAAAMPFANGEPPAAIATAAPGFAMFGETAPGAFLPETRLQRPYSTGPPIPA